MKINKKLIIFGILVGISLSGFVSAAPTSTIVQNLLITDLKSVGNPCLKIGTNGLVATTTCGAGGSGSTTTINSFTGSVFDLLGTPGQILVSTTNGSSTWSFATTSISQWVNNGLYATSSSLGSAAYRSLSDFLASTTTYVATTTGNWLGTWQLKTPSDFLASSTTYVANTLGNWIGTWQGVNSSTFYLASNPSGYITTSTGLTVSNFTSPNISQWTNNANYATTTIGSVLQSISASNPITYNTSTGAIGWTNSNNYISTSTSLTIANFATSSISQWNNNSGYLTSAITSLNGLVASSQFFATSSSGSGFDLTSSVSTHTLRIGTASGSNTGLLTSTDWNTFNNKQNAISFPIPVASTSLSASFPLNLSGNVLSIPTSTSATSGYLSAGDWTTFNNKLSNLNGALLIANNLNDLNNTSTARTNIGLGTGNSPTFTGLNLTGDLGISTDGSSTSTPRVLGFTNLSANENARFQFGDNHNALQNGYGQDQTLYSYWGIVLQGGMQNYNTNFAPPPFTKTTNAGVLIMSPDIGHDPSTEGSRITTLAIQATTSQSSNLTEWRNNVGTPLAIVDALGHIVIGSSATSSSALNVVGAATMNSLTLSTPLAIGSGGLATTTTPANNALLVGNGTNYLFSVLPDCDTTTGKLIYTSSTHTLSCGTDAGAGGGITSIQGLTASSQTFDKVDDTNVTLTISTTSASNHRWTLGWTGTLADGRIASAGTWNAKQNAITFPIPVASTSLSASLPLILTGNVLSIPTSTSATSGYLSAGDWTTFNNKISTSTGLVVANFASPNISQWTNNSNYITLLSLSASNPITYNTSTGAIGWTNSNNYISTSTGLTTANFATTSISQWNNNSGYITTSTGLTTANFATTSISQWNNNSGYITTSTALTTANFATTSVSQWNNDAGYSTLASSTWLKVANNLSDLNNASTARINLNVASSTLAFNIYDATSTTPYKFSKYRSPINMTITQIDCDEYAAATTTVQIYRATAMATTTVNSNIVASLACGIGGTSTTSFTTSTIATGNVIIVNATSTAGTPTLTTVHITYNR